MASTLMGASFAFDTQSFSQSKTWLRLLQYEKVSTGYESRIDAPSFFLAKNGKTNPLKELEATISAFKENKIYQGNIEQPIKCAFAARYRLLKDHLNLSPQEKCDDYFFWKNGLDASSLSLIFASSYPNNPASIFGHTFMRINSHKSKKAKRKRDILDYGLNYAATTGSDGGIEFAIFGVFGLYEGHFSMAPYYIKVNEYNNYESRDLFEYELKLTQKQVELFIDMIWEIESNGFSHYYFFDENCSFQLLALMEALFPEKSFLKNLPFYVSPIDTVKVLIDEKIAIYKTHRPSLRSEFLNRFNQLTISQKNELDSLLKGDQSNYSITSLDTALYYYKYKSFKEKHLLKKEDKALYQSLLDLRSKESGHYNVTIKEDSLPHFAHGPQKFSFGYLNRFDENFLTINFRLGWHDELDPDLGHIPFSRLELLKISTILNENQFKLDRFTLIDVLSIEPSNHQLTPSYAWKISHEKTFLAQRRETFIELGPGVAFESLSGSMRFFSLIKTKLSLSEELKNNHDLRLIPNIGLIIKGSLNASIEALIQRSLTKRKQINEGPLLKLSLSLPLKGQQLRLKTLYALEEREHEIELNFSFSY
ncbi:DUF4105 domain-containing protein [Halobacteriovorax sp. GB3]|uniref:Lnb N-terminal periplasmic domain-containing protein n=1 Tax=Halobacteriovorax sp. GB3 TaxID=2719615 RepID=UPI00235FF37F|nr:DUF4105 domain-containing protein [Halobacteriovorax sp. GB3]MDD0853848.1 DUF4105 domain-containing protein [Halobacteriovorax sp. GB3]